MALERVCALADVPPDSAMEVMVRGEPYAICNVRGTITALSGVCPHAGGPLGQGTISKGRIVCPFHMWAFDCATGRHEFAASLRVPSFETRVEGGDVFIDVP